MSAENICIRIETPHKQPITREVVGIFLETYDGIMEILPNHGRIVFALGVGSCRLLLSDGGEEKLALYEGLAHLKNNELLVLSKNSEIAKEIDINRCEEALRRIKRRRDGRDPELPPLKIDKKRMAAAEKRARIRLEIAKEIV